MAGSLLQEKTRHIIREADLGLTVEEGVHLIVQDEVHNPVVILPHVYTDLMIALKYGCFGDIVILTFHQQGLVAYLFVFTIVLVRFL